MAAHRLTPLALIALLLVLSVPLAAQETTPPPEPPTDAPTDMPPPTNVPPPTDAPAPTDAPTDVPSAMPSETPALTPTLTETPLVTLTPSATLEAVETPTPTATLDPVVMLTASLTPSATVDATGVATIEPNATRMQGIEAGNWVWFGTVPPHLLQQNLAAPQALSAFSSSEASTTATLPYPTLYITYDFDGRLLGFAPTYPETIGTLQNIDGNPVYRIGEAQVAPTGFADLRQSALANLVEVLPDVFAPDQLRLRVDLALSDNSAQTYRVSTIGFTMMTSLANSPVEHVWWAVFRDPQGNIVGQTVQCYEFPDDDPLTIYACPWFEADFEGFDNVHSISLYYETVGQVWQQAVQRPAYEIGIDRIVVGVVEQTLPTATPVTPTATATATLTATAIPLLTNTPPPTPLPFTLPMREGSTVIRLSDVGFEERIDYTPDLCSRDLNPVGYSGNHEVLTPAYSNNPQFPVELMIVDRLDDNAASLNSRANIPDFDADFNLKFPQNATNAGLGNFVAIRIAYAAMPQSVRTSLATRYNIDTAAGGYLWIGYAHLSSIENSIYDNILDGDSANNILSPATILGKSGNTGLSSTALNHLDITIFYTTTEFDAYAMFWKYPDTPYGVDMRRWYNSFYKLHVNSTAQNYKSINIDPIVIWPSLAEGVINVSTECQYVSRLN